MKKIQLPTIKHETELNTFSVYDDNDDFLIGFEIDVFEKEMARKLAEAYVMGYEQGRDDQAGEK